MVVPDIKVRVIVETEKKPETRLHLRLPGRNTLALSLHLITNALSLLPADANKADLEWAREDLIRQDAAQSALADPLIARVLPDDLVRD